MYKSPLSKLAKTVFISGLLVATGQSFGAVGSVSSATVYNVIIMNDDTYGGCMARLTQDPRSVLPACGRWWVSFDCEGVNTDPVRAYRMLDQAQMAKAIRKPVRIDFTDDLTFNGYCTVTRIDVLP